MARGLKGIFAKIPYRHRAVPQEHTRSQRSSNEERFTNRKFNDFQCKQSYIFTPFIIGLLMLEIGILRENLSCKLKLFPLISDLFHSALKS